MDVVTGGRLLDAEAAPPTGEVTQVLGTAAGFVVEQILSGLLDAPVDFDQDHDEWLVVLEGGAVLDVDGETRTLGCGDWLFLPAHAAHRLVSTQAGTSWLAVRSRDDDARGARGGGAA